MFLESEVRPEVQQELEGTNLVNYKTCRKAMRGTGLIVVPTELCAIDKNQGICFVSMNTKYFFVCLLVLRL